MAIKVSGTEVISDDKRILNNEDLPDIRPSLLLDFANSKTLDPRITFTRGSTATYWDGKTTAKAEENLFYRSQEFENSYWTKARVNVTANATTAPDGTTTADAINQASGETTLGRVFRTSVPNSAGVTTVSIYAKANTRNFLAINTNDFIDTGFNYTWFNLSTGAVGTTYSGHTASITDVGNGWYRCSITFTSVAAGAEGDVGFAPADTDGSTTVTDDQKGIYIWGAQLEQRSSATAYTATTDSSIVKYQPVLQTAASGEARFDHDPVTGESKGLLIEETRTNLLPYSAASVASWDNIGLLYLSDSSQNALGVFDGVIVASAGADWHRLRTGQFATTDGQDYAVTVWIQKGSSSGFRIVFRDDDSASECRVDATWGSTTLSENSSVGAGTLSNSSIVYLTDTIAQVNFIVNKDGSSTNTNISIGPDSATSGDTVIVLGAQLEQGSFPTSYIPTSGSTVTRARDGAIISGDSFSDIFTQTGLCIYGEGLYSAPQGNGLETVGLIGLDNSTTSEVLYIGVNTSNNASRLQSRSNSSVDVNLANSGAIDGTVKFSASLATDDVAFVRDGLSAATDLSFVLPKFTRLQIGYHEFGSAWNNTISKIAIYPKRLPNATLQAMTEA